MSAPVIAIVVFIGALVTYTVWALMAGARSGTRRCLLALAAMALGLLGLALAAAACHSGHVPDVPLDQCFVLPDSEPLPLRALGPIGAALGLIIGSCTAATLIVDDESQRAAEQFGQSWRDLSAQVGDGWRQEGGTLSGSHAGRRFAATVVHRPPSGQHDFGHRSYRVRIFLVPGGCAWRLRRSRGWRPWCAPSWTVRSRDAALAQRLEVAGATALAERAEHHLDVPTHPRLDYRSTDGILVLRTTMCHVPTSEALTAHLDFLIALGQLDERENIRR